MDRYKKTINVLEEAKALLLKEARARYGNIRFCGDATNWDDCLTIEFGALHLWFNVGKDTRMISMDLDSPDEKLYCEDQMGGRI